MTSQKQQHEIDRFQVERLIFFSDAVFAIAITLLILEIKVPQLSGTNLTLSEKNEQITQALLQQLHVWNAFITSFVIIAISWNSHHQMFGYVDHHDGKLIFLNFVFLMSIVIVPFSAAFISQYPILQTPFLFYTGNIMVVGLTEALIWRYISHHKGFISKRVPHDVRRLRNIRSVIVPLSFMISIGIYFILKNTLIKPEMATLYALNSWFVFYISSQVFQRIYKLKA